MEFLLATYIAILACGVMIMGGAFIGAYKIKANADMMNRISKLLSEQQEATKKIALELMDISIEKTNNSIKNLWKEDEEDEEAE